MSIKVRNYGVILTKSPIFFFFIIRKDNNKDQTKSLPLRGHINRELSLICERQNEEKNK